MKKTLEVIVPLWNEEEVIEHLAKSIYRQQEFIDVELKMTFIDDGSTDSTPEKLKDISQRIPNVKLITLSRNFGQHPAIMAGLMASSSDLVIVMDGDLQDRPEIIQELVLKMDEGWPIVFVERTTRATSWVYRLVQKLFYKSLNLLTEIDFNYKVANFSIISNEVLRSYQSLNGSILYYPAAIKWLGYEHASIKMNQAARFGSSKPKYSIRSRSRLAINIVLSHSQKPLQISTGVGFATSFLAGCYGMYAVIQSLVFNSAVSGWTSLVAICCFFFGIQFIFLGVFGLYLGNINRNIMHRPNYLIRNIHEKALK